MKMEDTGEDPRKKSSRESCGRKECPTTSEKQPGQRRGGWQRGPGTAETNGIEVFEHTEHGINKNREKLTIGRWKTIQMIK